MVVTVIDISIQGIENFRDEVIYLLRQIRSLDEASGARGIIEGYDGPPDGVIEQIFRYQIHILSRLARESLAGRSYQPGDVIYNFGRTDDGGFESVKKENLYLNWRALSWDIPLVYSAIASAKWDSPILVTCAGLLLARDLLSKRRMKVSYDHGAIMMLFWDGFEFDRWYTSKEVVSYLEEAIEKQIFEKWDGPKRRSIREILIDLSKMKCVEIDGHQIRLIERVEIGVKSGLRRIWN